MYKRFKEVKKLQKIGPKYTSMREYTQKVNFNYMKNLIIYISYTLQN